MSDDDVINTADPAICKVRLEVTASKENTPTPYKPLTQ